MKKSLRSLLAFLIAATVLCCIALADTGPKPSASFTFTGMPDEDYYSHHAVPGGHLRPPPGPSAGRRDPRLCTGAGRAGPRLPRMAEIRGLQVTPTATISSRICSSSATAMTKPDGAISPRSSSSCCSTSPKAIPSFAVPSPHATPSIASTVWIWAANPPPKLLRLLSLIPTATLSPPAPSRWIKPTARISRSSVSSGGWGITLVIELALAWGWKYRKGSQLLFIGVANLLTQCLLNASLLYWGARETSRGAIIFWYILLELAVTGIEAAAYAYLLPGTDRKAPCRVPPCRPLRPLCQSAFLPRRAGPLRGLPHPVLN